MVIKIIFKNSENWYLFPFDLLIPKYDIILYTYCIRIAIVLTTAVCASHILSH